MTSDTHATLDEDMNVPEGRQLQRKYTFCIAPQVQPKGGERPEHKRESYST